MADAPRDQNHIPTALFESSSTPGLTLPGQIDEITGRVLTDNAGSSGTVTTVSVVTANGVSGSVATATTTPAITLNISALDATKIANGSVSSTEFQYLDGVTSSIQTQLDNKISSGTALTLFPHAVGSTTDASIGITLTNTTAYFGQLDITKKITINKISFRVNSFTVATTFDIALYSEDGQTKLFDVTSANVTATGVYTTAVSSVIVTPGIYYVAIVANSVLVDISLDGWFIGSTSSGLSSEVSSKPILTGTKTVTAGTLPITFNPTNDLTPLTATIQIRLDN